MVTIDIEKALTIALNQGIPHDVIEGILDENIEIAHLTINSFIYENSIKYLQVGAIGMIYEASFDGESDRSMKDRILQRMLELSKKR